MRPYSLLLALILSLVSLAAARSASGDKVLVVLEPSLKRDDYSKFWKSLQDRGFELTFKEPKDRDAELVKYGELKYDHLVMFAPGAKTYSPTLSPKSILHAQFAGLNTLYVLSPDLTESNKEFLREYDLEFIDSSQTLIDPFNHPVDSSSSTVSLSPTSSLVQDNGEVASPSTLSGGPIIYPSGTVHTTGDNPYLIDVLHASKYAYVGQDKLLSSDEAEVDKSLNAKGTKEPILNGRKATLVSALQTRDNVRVGFVGSTEMIKDIWWDKEVKTKDGKSIKTGNAAFISDFSKWIFQETGVVKIVDSTHYRKGETEPRELYTKKDDITYSLTLAKHYTTSNGTSAWEPFEVDDIQLEFTMLDPHIRTALKQDKSAVVEQGTNFKARFDAPDRHGVFKFVVEYWRPGWSYIRSSQTASVVPLRHDEYPRFIVGAWPYYIAACSTSLTFLAFCALWVSLGEGDKDRKGKKKAE
ncbi:oligosaccharyltransferase complex subunit beta [Kwoniella mangroviensis CBS 8886]|nr:oligosaccharyltransferase complex subunit beta [Kwoniella mangroviensis CBS 8886]